MKIGDFPFLMDGLTSFYFRAEVVGKLKKEVVAGTKEEEVVVLKFPDILEIKRNFFEGG